MPHPPLVILGYSPAAMYCRVAPRLPGAVISVHGRREFAVETLAGVPRLDLTFDDVDVPPAGDPVAAYFAAARRRWRADNGLVETPPTAADAAAVIAFAGRIETVDGVVLCHCGAGVSRSTAAAVICLAVWLGDDAAAVAELYALRPMAVPHAGLVAFADALLGRGGWLSAAVAAGLRPIGGRAGSPGFPPAT